MAYKGWDVHAYTNAWLPTVKKHSQAFAAPIDQKDFQKMLQDISKRYAPRKLNALHKIARLYQSKIGGYFDPQFNNINVARLLASTWSLVSTVNNEDVFQGFYETLQDVGTNCVQGDSHRLFAYWIALERSTDEK
jgi:hypothetical protein